MKVLVIGGAGYIGSHAVYELIRKDIDVVVMDNLSTGDASFVPKDVKLYVKDLTKKTDIQEVIKKEENIDVIMHFAAKLIVPESVEKPLEYYHNNVEGVRLLLEVMKEEKIKNLVFSSTAAVYGEPANDVCKEEDATVPINPYGDSKLSAEKLIQYASEAFGINYCIFRYFNVAGADKSLEIGLQKDSLTHLIPVTVETLLGKREEMHVYGDDYSTPDGTCIRDYIHVSDLAEAHVSGALYIKKENKSEIINLGSNEGYSVLEIIKAVGEFGEVNYSIKERRAGDPAKLIASNDKAKKVLDWTPQYNLKDIIHSDIKYREAIKKVD